MSKFFPSWGRPNLEMASSLARIDRAIQVEEAARRHAQLASEVLGEDPLLHPMAEAQAREAADKAQRVRLLEQHKELILRSGPGEVV